MVEAIILQRGRRLFEYFAALTNLRTNHVLDFAAYEESFFLSAIPKQPGCHTLLWGTNQDDESDRWIEIKKPKRNQPPPLPKELLPWIDLGQLDNSLPEPPRPSESVAIIAERKPFQKTGPETDAPQFLKWADQTSLHSLYESYVQTRWAPWALEDRKTADVQAAFSKLFSIYQSQKRLGETYEVILAFGLLFWKSGPRVLKRHILTTPCTIEFDLKQETLIVKPPGDGTKLEIDTDWLQADERPQHETEEALVKQAGFISEELWDQIQVHEVLRSWVISVSSRGQYLKETSLPEQVTEQPVCHYVPAIILRKRTQKTLIAVFKKIARDFEVGTELTSTMEIALTGALLPVLADGVSDSDIPAIERTSNDQPDDEIYFPLLSNDQQTEIVTRLRNKTGVLVQGPPGTGKSHTIANLICHLLAKGQRVLVTSHAPRALEVLKEKLPPEISPLCVCLLANDTTAMDFLEESVQGITTRFNNWNPVQNKQQVAQLDQELDKTRREISLTEKEIISLKEKSSFTHDKIADHYSGTEQEIAEKLNAERDRYSWILRYVDSLSAPPTGINSAILTEFLRISADATSIPRELLQSRVPIPASLPSEQIFADLVRDEASAKDTLENQTNNIHKELLRHLSSTGLDVLSRLLESLDRVHHLLGSIANHAHSAWATPAAIDILSEKDRKWRHILNTSKALLAGVRGLEFNSESVTVTGLPEGVGLEQVYGHAKAMMAELERGKRLLIWPFCSEAVLSAKYIVRKVRVNGALCDKPGPLGLLLKYLEVALTVQRFEKLWVSVLPSVPSGSLMLAVGEYEDLCKPIERALQLFDITSAAKETIRLIAGLPEPKWYDQSHLRTYSNTVRRKAAECAVGLVRQRFETLVHEIRKEVGNNPHSAVDALVNAIVDRNVSLYQKAREDILSFVELKETVTRFDSLCVTVGALSPLLRDHIRFEPHGETWAPRLSDFDNACRWLIAYNWLRKRNGADYSRSLEQRSEDLFRRERALLARLAAENAWKHCFSRMTEKERQSLIGWSQSIRRIGRTGTGKRAVHARKAAREYMAGCRSAIPAWIMPLYRVAESVEPIPNSFDVVIVDEASQCGPEALFLAYLAKKVVVVGDDKQISPEDVGISVADLEALKTRYLKDVPHAFHYGGSESSLFALADILFGDRIPLREHFRCMPEIIQFSNALSYSNQPLIPLKQFGVGRLQPVVSAHYVADGYEQGEKKCNPPESEAIVAHVQKCINDPVYLGKTFGIISLVGHGGAQINFLNKLILQRISPKEISARKLICGDAYSFQGDERDIILISMVVAPRKNKGIYALTKETDRKRFNVAASRAKEQMVLFHSVTENDLGEEDFRYKFLNYCKNPKLEPISCADNFLRDLEKKIKNTQRKRGTQPEPFDSWFEVDVFLDITRQGYRVIPQYEIAGRRIDLVIETTRGRLAIECYGDEWHGPDRALADFNRQRLLQRCGFTFWIVVGSEYYLDRQKSMQSLWSLLSDMNGTLVATASAVNTAATVVGMGPSSAVMSEATTSVATVRESIVASATPAFQSSDVVQSAPIIGIEIEEYSLSKATGLPDPRNGTYGAIVSGLQQIVREEGPMLVSLLYKRYVQAAGFERSGSQIRDALKNRIYSSLRSGKLAFEKNPYSNKFEDRIIFGASTQSTRVRKAGGRHLSEIPITEITALMRRLLKERACDKSELFREMLEIYGFARLTKEVAVVLDRAYEHMSGGSLKGYAEGVPASRDAVEEYSIENCNNLISWSAISQSLSNNVEMFLLANIRSYLEIIKRKAEPDPKTLLHVRRAFERATELGFDVSEDYSNSL